MQFEWLQLGTLQCNTSDLSFDQVVDSLLVKGVSREEIYQLECVFHVNSGVGGGLFL